MLRKNIAVLIIIVGAALSVGGSPFSRVNPGRNDGREIATKTSMSESTSLLLFGSGLWALAAIRRQRRPTPGI